jgi:hypothetical protein
MRGGGIGRGIEKVWYGLRHAFANAIHWNLSENLVS